MKMTTESRTRCLLFLALTSVLVSGCSDGASVVSEDGGITQANSPVVDESSETDSSGITENNPIPAEPNDSTSDNSDSSVQNNTRVNFEITVPVYQSDALNVSIIWGDTNRSAAWVTDESWLASVDIPSDTENRLTVTFADQNGAITLGSFVEDFRTGTNESETYTVLANQFDTNQWDDDSDGVSNLDELNAGTNPFGDEVLVPVLVNLELRPDKIFRFSWQPSPGAEFYRVLENADGVSGFTEISENLTAATSLYDHRVALHRRTSASYIVQACNDQGCTDSEIVSVPESLLPATNYFKASDSEELDNFGATVELSSDGNTMAVQSRAGGSGNESVYVFSRLNGSWQEQAILDGSGRRISNEFGDSMSLSANGDLLAVGSPEDILSEAEGGGREGAVYLYQRESGRWRETTKLLSTSLSTSSVFGLSVSLSADGSTLAVGAHGRNGEDSDVGVFIFEFIDGSWQPESPISLDGQSPPLGNADSVSLSEDGKTLAVGFRQLVGSGDSGAARAGAVYVFSRSDAGWEQQAFLRAEDEVEGANFGLAVSLDADGDVLVVGAPGWNTFAGDDGPSFGVAYMFRNIDGVFQQEAQLINSFFPGVTGAGVDVSGDGTTVAVSSLSINSVAIYTYVGGSWLEQVKLVSEGFSAAVSLSSDGESLAVGATDDSSASTEINGDRDDDSSFRSGAVFLF